MLRSLAAGILFLFALISTVALFQTFKSPSIAGIIAHLIVGAIFVGLPAWSALKLLRGRQNEDPKPISPPPVAPVATVPFEVEVLKLARRLGGRLTAMEVVTELGVGVDKAEAVLKDLNKRGIAGVLISDSGLLVYSFRELENLDEKDSAEPLLDA